MKKPITHPISEIRHKINFTQFSSTSVGQTILTHTLTTILAINGYFWKKNSIIRFLKC